MTFKEASQQDFVGLNTTGLGMHGNDGYIGDKPSLDVGAIITM